MSGLSKFYSSLAAIGNFLQPFFLLAIRLFWGWMFFKAGFTKFEDMEKVAGYFGKIGIPLSTFSAYLAATTEMVGGLFLLFGSMSRLVTIPLIITMIVALFTAHYETTSLIFSDPSKVLALGPFTFLMATLTIFVFGPGMFSLDALLKIEPRKEKITDKQDRHDKG